MCVRRRDRGYILVETIVAMGLLSISMIVIQSAIRQAIITRGQAQDYTTARFLMQQIVAEREMELETPESSGKGAFEEPYARFSYEWGLTKVKVPRPRIPEDFPSGQLDMLKRTFKGYMGKLRVEIQWTRAGRPFSAVGQTLLRPEQLWLPPEEREALQNW